MSSSSNINCCVPLCNQRGTIDANGKRGGFNFPKDPNLWAQWLQKIPRDAGTKFKLMEITKVCSLHFHESEIKNGRQMKEDECRHHRSSFEICMAHFTAKGTVAVCKIFTEEEQAWTGRALVPGWRPFVNKVYQKKMRGQRGRLPVKPLGYVMSTKVIFRRAEVFVSAEVCLPRRPRADQPWCDV